MFAGIVEELGRVKVFNRKVGGGARMTVAAPVLGAEAAVGHSISINGVCLTVEEINGNDLSFDLSEETLRVTALGRLGAGDSVNLELSLKVGERLGGHFVSGHVDEVGAIVSRRDEGDCTVFQIRAGAGIRDLLVDRGSVAIDGISLTVTKVLPKAFEVVIIPHTARMTTLGFKTVGDQVNLEADMIGKYVTKLVGRGGNGI
ncbi:MAG: riboflavin synthase [Actinomycetota bacterium]|nr:riboflavin synthase [Actinomycetota bacterium]